MEIGSLVLVEDWVGIAALIVFAVAYVFVVLEEFSHKKGSVVGSSVFQFGQ